MPHKRKGFSRFWKELRRRNVLRSLAIYAGSAFIILEAATIIFPRWGLPDWSIDLVLWLLVLGIFINVIIAWFYDITPGGMLRTKSLEEVSKKEKVQDSRGWKAATYVSLVVIVALVIFNVFTSSKTLKAGDIQSLLVLPFDNFTGDDQLEYFVSGMHASLIGDIGKVGGLRVISKTSSDTYKEAGMSIPEIASELNVDAVVETQVMCLGDSICFQVKVVTPFPEEKQLWVADYKEEKSQILNLYNRVTKQIANEVLIELSPDEERMLTQSRTVNKEAYDDYLMGLYYWDKLGKEPLEKALEYFNSAIELDPEWAPPYAGVARVWAGMAQMNFVAPQIAGPIIFEHLNKALALDPDFADSHLSLAGIATWIQWDWETGEKEYLKALSINPNNAMARIYYAHLLMHLQRKKEALIHAQMAVDLDPLNPLILALNAVVLCYGDQWEVAHERVEKAIALDPYHFFAFKALEPVAYHLGNIDGLLKSIRFCLPFEDSIYQSIAVLAEKEGINAAYSEVVNQLELLGPASQQGPIAMAARYLFLKQYDKAMEYMEQGFEMHDSNTPYIACAYWKSGPLLVNPRFIALMEKMKLPMPKD